MSYFITGGTGFIGRNFIDKLKDREGTIYVLTRSGSEHKFQDLQERLVSVAQNGTSHTPVGLLFIDEIDALCPKRSDGSSASASANPEARLVATLLTLMDGVDKKGGRTADSYHGALTLAS